MFKDTVLLAFFIPLLVALVVIAFFALFIVVAPLLILVATMAHHRSRKAVNPAVLRQLQAFPLVATAIDTADEYQIDVRGSRLL